jgi:hypothetical protein
MESGRFFEKKLRKKLLIPPAFERPNCGRSKAGGNKSFLVLFFKKEHSSFYMGAMRLGAIAI